MHTEFVYSVATDKTLDEAVVAVKANAEKLGFRVLTVHDVTTTLAQKGFEREPLQMIEICHAPSLHRVLGADVNIAYFTPCKVNVYVQNGSVFIGTLKPTLMSQFFPGAGIDEVAETVEASIQQIIDSSR